MDNELTSTPSLQKNTSSAIAWASDLNKTIDAVKAQFSIPQSGIAQPSDPIHHECVPAVVTGVRGYGAYLVNIGFWKGTIPASGTFDLTNLYDLNETKFPAVLINQGESNRSSNRIGTGVAVEAFPTGIYTNDDPPLPVYITNYSRAIRDMRWNAVSNCIEVTYQDLDAPTEWICKVNFTACP